MNWLKPYLNRKIAVIFLLGISSGFPLALCMGTLTVWLTESGVTKQSIGLFSALTVPYTLKFLWSPFFDAVKLPYLTKLLGKRRAWLIVTQILLGLSVIGLGLTSPQINLYYTALMALIVSFMAASQDINVDAYRVEYLKPEEYGIGSTAAVFSYRIAYNLIVGAGALYIADAGINWHSVYFIMSSLVIVGIMGVLLGEKPKKELEKAKTDSYFKYYVINPFRDFMGRNGWLAFLAIAVLYKLPDAVLGSLANNFYLEIGFTKSEIASVSKLFGFSATLLGSFIGGIVVTRFGLYRSLVIGGFVQAITVLIFSLQALAGHNIYFLMGTIGLENLGSGIGDICIVVFISNLCNKHFTATQFALLSSLSALGRTFLRAPSGFVAVATGWFWFFIISAITAIPGLIVIYMARNKIRLLTTASAQPKKLL